MTAWQLPDVCMPLVDFRIMTTRQTNTKKYGLMRLPRLVSNLKIHYLIIGILSIILRLVGEQLAKCIVSH